MATPASTSPPPRAGDAREPVALLYRDLRAGPNGLSSRGAARRLVAYGPNVLERRTRSHWPAQIVRQVSHPLALLLWAASALAFVAGMVPLGVAIVVVILLNAGVRVRAGDSRPSARSRRCAAYLPRGDR